MCLPGGEIVWVPERRAEEEDTSATRLCAAAEACQALLAMTKEEPFHRAVGCSGTGALQCAENTSSSGHARGARTREETEDK